MSAVTAIGAARRAGFVSRLPWTGYAAVVVLLAYAAAATAASVLARYAPDDIFVGGPFDPPSPDFWLGTDGLGRDVASRLLFGGRTVLAGAAAAATLSASLGGLLGLWLGLRGGWVDEVAMRLLEIVMSIPPIILALLVFGLFTGAPALVVSLTVGLLFVPNVTRVVRAATLATVNEDFVAAARARGERGWSIALREILPNVAGTVLVEFSVRTGYAILFIGGLGFLGLGAAPPSPGWGLMINEGRSTLDQSPWPVVAPAVGMAVLVVAVNLLTDAILRCLGPADRSGIRP